MANVTQILSRIESGDPSAAEQLLPLVYEELRKLAAVKLASEKPGQTLQATALVHEAYLRLLGPGGAEQSWNSRGHFFGAAAEAMRRILVENARRKNGPAAGGGRCRVELRDVAEEQGLGMDLVALSDALDKLHGKIRQCARGDGSRNHGERTVAIEDAVAVPERRNEVRRHIEDPGVKVYLAAFDYRAPEGGEFAAGWRAAV